jgi:energy-coupling factor transporter ATP-binding protein EcfA2
LELGSGFNPDFTGRENVYLNAAVLGLSRKQTDAKFDSIAAFADIGDFIEQPVKTYSSGMVMRLAFSIQTSVDPDILIIDEALAVGDAQFVAKCINRVSEFIRSGKTLLFVSHEVGMVRQLTSRSLYLDHGAQIAFGATPETILTYTNTLTLSASTPQTDPNRFTSENAPFVIGDCMLVQLDEASSIQVIDAGAPARMIVNLEPCNTGPAKLTFSVYNYMGVIVFCAETDLPVPQAENTTMIVQFDILKVHLAAGSYRVNFALRNGVNIVAWARDALHFDVRGESSETYIYREDIRTSFVHRARH